MGVHVFMVWFLVDLVVHSMGFDGEVVEWHLHNEWYGALI